MVTCIHVPCCSIHITPLSLVCPSICLSVCLCHGCCVVQACLGLAMYSMLSSNLWQDSCFKCPSFKKQFYYIMLVVCTCTAAACSHRWEFKLCHFQWLFLSLSPSVPFSLPSFHLWELLTWNRLVFWVISQKLLGFFK